MTVQEAGRDIRVVIVDDHPGMREAIRDLLAEEGLRVVGEATDGIDVDRIVSDAKPDVVVMDLAMPRVNGVQATRQLKMQRPETSVVMLSKYSDRKMVDAALDAGASGYVLKQNALEDLIPAIQAVRRGQRFISDSVEA